MRGASFAIGCAALVALGCGPAGEGATCPNDLPAACPSPAPSYAAEVGAIIQTRCASCHAPGGQEASMPLVTYEQIQRRSASMLTQVYACRMPKAGAPPLADAERKALLEWLVCRAPNN
jgi:hypothetical protein